MATAAIEEPQLLKSLRWYDGFVVALANPGFLIGSLGFSIGALGGWGAMLLWGISMFLGVLQNWIYSETAAMFPDKSGGIALYANEGWKRYFSLVGPVATFGYWFAWSTGAVDLRHRRRLSGSDPVVLQVDVDPVGRVGSPDASPLHRHRRDPARLGANMRGIRPTCGWAMSPAPSSWCRCSSSSSFHIHRSWSSGNMHLTINGAWGGWQLALVWLYIMGCLRTALRRAPPSPPVQGHAAGHQHRSQDVGAVLAGGLPPAAARHIGRHGFRRSGCQPTGFLCRRVREDHRNDRGVRLMVVLLCASLILSMNTATADGFARAVRHRQGGLDDQAAPLPEQAPCPVPGHDARHGDETRTHPLRREHAVRSGRRNLGYIAAHVFALTGFLLLRKDRPGWPRPIKLSAIWLPIAGFLAAANLVFIVVGNMYPDSLAMAA